MKIAFVMSDWVAPKLIDPTNLFNSDRGLSGSETSMIMFALELAKFDHEIFIFAPFTTDYIDKNINFVSSIQSNHYRAKWDVVFAWIDPRPLKQFTNTTKRIFNQQVNDFGYCTGWEKYIDIITSPSNTHKNYLSQFSEFKNWFVLPNGCNPNDFIWQERQNRILYASSPDRGLHWLLEMFPHIKKHTNVELHIFYDWKNFYNITKDCDNEFGKRSRYCHEALSRLKNKGVVHHDAVSKKVLSQYMCSSKLLTYPCDPMSFTEGFSVTTLESAIAGCVPIISSVDALEEIYKDYVPMIPAPIKNNKQDFINLTIELLSNSNLYNKWQEKSKQLANIYSWENITNNILLKLL